MPRCYIQLGRNGDILNIVPILYHQYQLTSQPQRLLVSAEFARLMEGFSYIKPILWKGEWRNLVPAIQWAKQHFSEVVPMATFGHGMPFKNQFTSFQIDQWARAGYAHHWGELPLIVDKRSPEREKKLVDKHAPGNTRLILVADVGSCSPFKSRTELVDLLNQRYGKTHKVLRLSEVLADYPFDLLGLYDRAEALVTIDTMHLHLSSASRVPVYALAVNTYGEWAASAYHPRFRFWGRYTDWPRIKQQLVEAVGKEGEPVGQRIVHVWSEGKSKLNTDNDAQRRWNFAKVEWGNEYHNGNWIQAPYMEEQFARNARTVCGEKASLPFIRDMVDYASAKVSSHDIIVLTNADTVPMSGISRHITDRCRDKGACFAHRWDFGRLELPITQDEMRYAKWYPGSDLFAFTKGWWEAYRGMYPDMIYGRDMWDMAMRLLIKITGGAELTKAIYHEFHKTLTLSGQPGSKHNAKEMEKLSKWKDRDDGPIDKLSQRASYYTKTTAEELKSRIEYVPDQITVVLPVCSKDKALMASNLEWQATLGCEKDFACVISADSSLDQEEIARLEGTARRAYREVSVFVYPTAPKPVWPNGPNWAFQQTVRHMAKIGKPWFWMESDCVPLCKGWLDRWNEEYQHCRKPIMGVVVPNRWHCNGTAIYPPNFAELSEKSMTCTNTAWDELMMSDTIRLTHDASNLLCHVWGIVNGKAHPHDGQPPSFPNWDSVKRWVNLDAVLMHRAKDITLIERLREHYKL